MGHDEIKQLYFHRIPLQQTYLFGTFVSRFFYNESEHVDALTSLIMETKLSFKLLIDVNIVPLRANMNNDYSFKCNMSNFQVSSRRDF